MSDSHATRRRPGARSAQAGVAYAGAVFAIGFALGTARVLVLTPRVGALAGVLVETPFILTASWWVSERCTKHFCVVAAVGSRILMGAIAFIVLMILELALALVVFGRTPAEYLASYQSAAGALGLTAQVCFAGLPLLQALRCRHTHRRSGTLTTATGRQSRETH